MYIPGGLNFLVRAFERCGEFFHSIRIYQFPEPADPDDTTSPDGSTAVDGSTATKSVAPEALIKKGPETPSAATKKMENKEAIKNPSAVSFDKMA